jgi:DNA segregation ATPase FtsK/SpoIIIE-like protein
MTNLAYNNSPDELQLDYLQLSKDDNWKYELLEHCKGCVTATSVPDKLKNVQMAYKMIKYIYDEMIKRGLEVKVKLGRESEDMNIHIYNKKFKNKLPVMMLWIDEAASVFKKDPNKDVNKLLEAMDYMIAQIGSAGRYVGVYLINVMQRASKDELPREVKINSLNLVSFNQVDGGASKVAIGDEKSALDLPPRVFAVKAGGENVKFAKTPFSKWDDNVNYLRKKEVIRPGTPEEIQIELEEVYAEWNIVEEDIANVSNKPTKKDRKLISKELTDMQKQLDAAQNAIKLLKFDNENKETQIKELMARIGGKEATEESLEKISELKYEGADKQMESS